VLLVLAIVAVLVWIERPWSYVVVGVAAAIEIGEAWFWWWLSHRRRPAVGVETLVGMTATVVSPCRPLGQVRVQGELWEARCERGADVGEAVEVVAVDGLTLVVA
jgi:membrane protein implicated in regulation of membrane protease activity